MESYAAMYDRSIQDPEGFWSEQAAAIPWFEPPLQALSRDNENNGSWFPGGMLNMSHLCLDAQVAAGRGRQTAIIYDAPAFGKTERISYQSLLDQVARFAAGLQNLGVQTGDRVVIYMPMIPQAIIAMLACARIGAIHSVVFGGFAPHELALRIDDARPKVIISASYGVEFGKKIPYKTLVDQALEEAQHQPDFRVYYRRESGFDHLGGPGEIDFEAMMRCGKAAAKAVPSTHPLYILYTSGTTGKPKGIVRDTGGYAAALHFTMSAFYDARPGDVFWAASDIGWVVGHSYIVYAPLLYGCTTLLYEGKPVRTPDAGAFWRVAAAHKVNIMFTAPTAIRAIRKEDPDGLLAAAYDLKDLKRLFLAGERCDPATFEWVSALLQKPVVDHWWQTESGWPMLGMMTAVDDRPALAGSAGFPVCGYAIDVLDESGQVLPPGAEGNLAVRLPLPPGCLIALWQNEIRFRKSYFERYPGYYLTGDAGYRDEEGHYFVMGRIDDVINVSGHRLSTGEIEEVLAAHPAVAECAVVGIDCSLRGQRPLGLVVLKDGATTTEEQLQEELVQRVRNMIGAVAVFKTALTVKRLPKTRSGKILRRTIAAIADGKKYEVPSTIEDPLVLTELRAVLEEWRNRTPGSL